MTEIHHTTDAIDWTLAQARFMQSLLQMSLECHVGGDVNDDGGDAITVHFDRQQVEAIMYAAGQVARLLDEADRMRDDLESAPH